MQYRTKLSLILLAVVGLTGALLLWLSHHNARNLVFKLIQEKVLAIAASTAPQVDGDAHERITREFTDASNAGRDDESEDYVKVRKPMRDARDANRPREDLDREVVLPVTFIYTFRPRTDGKVEDLAPYEYVVDAEEEGEDKSYIGDIVEFREGEDVIPPWGKAHVDSMFAEDEFGTWLSAFAPVKNSQGKDVALLGVDVEADEVKGQLRNLLIGGLIALAFAILVAAIASLFLSARVTAPLRTLEESVSRIGAGDLTTRISVDTNDEFGRLGKAINKMTEGLQEREAFKGALVRFVSTQDSDKVIEEQTDDTSGASRRVTVLIARLRGFSSISGSLPPDMVFEFLSDWYSMVIENVLQHHGSVEKSAGETVTVTFGAPLSDPAQERHAVEAALTMQNELADLVRRWDFQEKGKDLAISIVIHTGTATISERDGVQIMQRNSLERIIGAVSIFQDAVSSTQPEGIVVSEVTAERLKGTIPVSYLQSFEIPGTDEMLSLHSVEMPNPAG